MIAIRLKLLYAARKCIVELHAVDLIFCPILEFVTPSYPSVLFWPALLLFFPSIFFFETKFNKSRLDVSCVKLNFYIHVVSSDIDFIGCQLYAIKVIEKLACPDIIVPCMQRTFDYLAVNLAGGQRAILVATERLYGKVLAACIKQRNPCAIDVYFFATIALDFTLASYLDKRHCLLYAGVDY